MTPRCRKNLLKLPVVLFIRVPILLPFYILSRVGERAERIGEVIGRHLPGFDL